MTAKFYMLLALISVLTVAWLAVHYNFERTEQAQLEELCSYPIYAYVADTSLVSPLLSDLHKFPELDSLRIETGVQAGMELVETYSLPISDDLLATFKLPDLITLNLRAIPAARSARRSILTTLWRYLPEQDVDSQSIAWIRAEAKLKEMQIQKYIVSGIIALLMLIIFVWGRMNFELRLLLLHKRRMVSIVDYLRHKAATRNHSLMLLFVPLLLSFGLYMILVWQSVLLFLLPYWFIGLVSGILLIGSLIVMTQIHLMDHDNRLHEGEVTVTSPKSEPDSEY